MKKKQIRNKNGITLIALIITVVIMLILAGVAISAVVSGDGLFDSTKYAAELQNFSQMQEAIKLYNFNNAIDNTNTLPVTRNVSVEELENDQNLKTEIGYYRVFLLTGERPTLPQDFSGDFMETPGGVADLYYLDNEKLNANTNKQYIYDTVTGEIYLIEGVKVKGQIAYSESGMKEIMNENYIPSYVENVSMPPSPEPETGAGYDYNFIANSAKDTNLYKIYNNGEVYGIGQKGILLQTSDEEMESLRNDKWQEINFEEILPGFSKIFVGSQMYRNSQVLITDDGEAYVSGENGSRFTNKFGLSKEVLETYNENKLNKLDFSYGKIKKVFTGDSTTFIITEDNKLYAAGLNNYGQLGVGTYENTEEYMEVKGIEDVEKIENIHTYNDVYCIIIETEDNRYYFAGTNLRCAIGDGRSSSYKTNTFEQIWNSGEYDIDQDIKKLVLLNGTIILKNDGTLIIATNSNNFELTDYIDTDKTKFRRLREEVGSNITNIIVSYDLGIVIEQTINGIQKYYGYSYNLPTHIGIGEKDFTVDEKKFYEIELPSELKEEGVKEICNMYGRNGIIYISNAGNVYYTGDAKYSGIEGASGIITEITKLPINNIECIYNTGITYGMVYPYLQGKDGKIYTIQNPLSQLNKSLYSYTFKRMLTNVKEISTNAYRIAYVDNEKNLYVAGNDKSQLGLGTTDTSEQKVLIKIDDLNIENKVEKVYVGDNLYILTTEGKLYGTGKTDTNGSRAPGWSEQVDQVNFVEILSDVEGFYISQNSKIAYNQQKVWIWYGTTTWGEQYNTPYEIDLSSISSSLRNNIKDAICNNAFHFLILTKDGQVWSRGNAPSSGTGVNHSNFQQIPQSSFDNKKIVKIVTSGYDRKAFIALAEDGTLYGWGPDSSILGLGITSTVAQNTPIKLSIDNVKDVIGTASGFIVTKNNGEVWATGNNANGIFGRWISSDAKYAKTVNQNAYEWVRCPSLEK